VPRPRSRPKQPAAIVDLFCGAGGLTCGLQRAGLQVAAGVDLDPACAFPFSVNNNVPFLRRDVADLTPEELEPFFPAGATRVLVGCAPCQPFSRYSRGQDPRAHEKWPLLRHFSRLIQALVPPIVSMENVPALQDDSLFHEFVDGLISSGYHVESTVAFCPDYGIPQERSRLILLASRLGPIKLVGHTHSPRKYRTVKDAIGSLRPLHAGGQDSRDALHRACDLSPVNLRRIRASRPGGNWRDWPKSLVARCHTTESGKYYSSVYGRMEWNRPAPTITTQFFGYGNGRFGHPEQDRAISLREGALLQSFPRTYKFHDPAKPAPAAVIGRLVGNAVPVRLGEVIGRSILSHLRSQDGQ
jgi:DNA (cytosine-5)-methyltransferase 1